MSRPRLEAAREDRDDLLRNVAWLNSAEVAQLIGAESQTVGHVNQLCREKRLFGVRYRGEYLHLEFQFGGSGEIHPAIARLLEYLPSTDANWTAAFWLFQPHGGLGGKTPAEVFHECPHEIVRLAHEDFVTGPYEGAAG